MKVVTRVVLLFVNACLCAPSGCGTVSHHTHHAFTHRGRTNKNKNDTTKDDKESGDASEEDGAAAKTAASPSTSPSKGKRIAATSTTRDGGDDDDDDKPYSESGSSSELELTTSSDDEGKGGGVKAIDEPTSGSPRSPVAPKAPSTAARAAAKLESVAAGVGAGVGSALGRDGNDDAAKGKSGDPAETAEASPLPDDGKHVMYEKRFTKPTFCNVCKTAISTLSTTPVDLCCSMCLVACHSRCLSRLEATNPHCKLCVAGHVNDTPATHLWLNGEKCSLL